MILEHYSRKPLVWPPRDYIQPAEKEGWGKPMKPEGLWVSVPGEDDWPSWCRSEGFRVEGLRSCTRVVLSDDAKIRWVEGEAALRQFDADYGLDWRLSAEIAMRRIDWQRVALDYDGVIIAPYVWSCRLGGWDLVNNCKDIRARISDWYYPWDCASGCIWNGTNAIAAFERVGRRRKAA